jgi:preprotein translocase subunit YajC
LTDYTRRGSRGEPVTARRTRVGNKEGKAKDVLFAAESSGGGSFAPTLMMMLLLFGAMYFLFIRPNKRRRQQIEEMQRSIGPGDEVLTLGGLYGIVSEIDDDRVVLEVSPGSFNTYSRSSISRVVNAAPSLDEDEVSTAVDLDKTNEATAKKVIDTD